MARSSTRRDWLKTSAAGAAGLSLIPQGRPRAGTEAPRTDPGKIAIKVVVWDEQQPAQKQAYENFLGNQIAGHLKAQEGFQVRSVRLDDPEQGLAEEVLNDCQVLIWWGHVRIPRWRRRPGGRSSSGSRPATSR